ncbi:MAG: chemotaxis-specific protein-glutamate methyltransferase CheB [Sandaracinaceae bacterium]
MIRKILIADDSPTMRAFLSRAIQQEPTFRAEVAGDGEMALAAIQAGGIDAVVLDLEMPHMSGLEALDRIREMAPRLPVIVFSAYAGRGTRSAILALAAGADDIVTKPSIDVPGRDRELVGEELLLKLRALLADGVRQSQRSTNQIRRDLLIARRVACAAPGILALAASTGGPSALETLLAELPSSIPLPIVIAQHMPKIHTAHLARRLDERVPARVLEATQGAALEPGVAYVAPGDHHMRVVRHGGRDYVDLTQEHLRSGVMPSADALFSSVADVFGPRSTAVVLTGMGRDGLSGARAVRDAGGVVIAQDQESATVWGMPGQIVQAGLATEVLALEHIAGSILGRLRGVDQRVAS